MPFSRVSFSLLKLKYDVGSSAYTQSPLFEKIPCMSKEGDEGRGKNKKQYSKKGGAHWSGRPPLLHWNPPVLSLGRFHAAFPPTVCNFEGVLPGISLFFK